MARRILSFDVGTKNLAYAHVEVQEEGDASPITRVLAWGVIDVTEFDGPGPVGGRPASVVRSVLRALHSDPMFSDPDEWDVVLIENQPSLKNPSMKTVQVAINAFFELYIQQRGADDTKHVVLVNARNKVNDIVPKSSTYKERKRASVEACTAMLDAMDGAEVARETLKTSKKKDDLCDAFMQANWYCCNQRCSANKTKGKRGGSKKASSLVADTASLVADTASLVADTAAPVADTASLAVVQAAASVTRRRGGGAVTRRRGGAAETGPGEGEGEGAAVATVATVAAVSDTSAPPTA
jgi:hypothetical protein